jgi:hypothetical protein
MRMNPSNTQASVQLYDASVRIVGLHYVKVGAAARMVLDANDEARTKSEKRPRQHGASQEERSEPLLTEATTPPWSEASCFDLHNVSRERHFLSNSAPIKVGCSTASKPGEQRLQRHQEQSAHQAAGFHAKCHHCVWWELDKEVPVDPR